MVKNTLIKTRLRPVVAARGKEIPVKLWGSYRFCVSAGYEDRFLPRRPQSSTEICNGCQLVLIYFISFLISTFISFFQLYGFLYPYFNFFINKISIFPYKTTCFKTINPIWHHPLVSSMRCGTGSYGFPAFFLIS